MKQVAIEKLVAKWVGRLGLTHWKLTIDWEGDVASGSEANGELDEAYDEATLYFSPAYAEWTEAKAEHVVVHELLHLVTRDLEHAAEASRALIPKAARGLAYAGFEHELEGVIDRLASALVAVAAPADT